MVDPVDPVERCKLHRLRTPPRAVGRITSALYRPMMDSARAWSYERRLKGALVLTDPGVGSTTVQVDMRVLRDPHTLRGINDGTIAEKRFGIRMYKPEQLAQQKIEKAAQPGRRRRGKDRYNIAWWLRTRVECVNHAQRVALDQTLRFDHDLIEKMGREPRPRSGDEPDQSGRGTRRTDARTRLRPGGAATPMATRAIDGRHKLGGGAALWWGREAERPRTDAIADFAMDHELEMFMIRVGIWDRSEVPEKLRELTMERQRSIAMTQARSR